MEKLSHMQELQVDFIRLFIVTLGGSSSRYHNDNIYVVEHIIVNGWNYHYPLIVILL
jgi:hypothetical protein